MLSLVDIFGFRAACDRRSNLTTATLLISSFGIVPTATTLVVAVAVLSLTSWGRTGSRHFLARVPRV
jgi:hypothetical protein